MQVKILGCGPSYGMPSLTRGFGECDPKNPKNVRFRSSLLISDKGTQILIDTPPEIRLQLLGVKNRKLDALLYTHLHYDHTGGAEDVNKMVMDQGRTLDVYASQQDLDYFKNHQAYIFKDSYYHLHKIQMYKEFKVNHLSVLPIKQYHDDLISVGYRIGDFAYSTDLKKMDPKGFVALEGIHTWVLGGWTHKENKKHMCLDEAMAWVEKMKPKRVFLTHIGTHMDYDKLCQKLPKYIRPAYDGLTINIKR
jgi:phosphoribosyl 1,2-cyclic phosphate phosphodiesterase